MGLRPSGEEFRERVRANWTDAQTIDAWRRWHAKIAHQLVSVTDALIDAAAIRSGMSVLDLASGSGEPALRIATIVKPSGTVTATDLSAGMLDVARENAAAQNVTNISFAECDGEHLPFRADSFDAVTSRMGVMFFVDVQRAFAEMYRVLRSGGRVALAAWGDLERIDLFNAIIAPFLKVVTPPAPPPGAPQPFRFAEPGSLSSELQAGGFTGIVERTLHLPTPWPGTPEDAWNMFYDLAAPAYVDDLPAADREAAIAEAINTLRRRYDGRQISARSGIVIASAQKP